VNDFQRETRGADLSLQRKKKRATGPKRGLSDRAKTRLVWMGRERKGGPAGKRELFEGKSAQKVISKKKKRRSTRMNLQALGGITIRAI